MISFRLPTIPAAVAARGLLRLLLVGGLLLLALTGGTAVGGAGSDASRGVRASHAPAPAIGVRATTTVRTTSATGRTVSHTTDVRHTDAALAAARASTSAPARTGLPAGVLPSRRGPPAGTFLLPGGEAGVDVPLALAPSPAAARAPPSAA